MIERRQQCRERDVSGEKALPVSERVSVHDTGRVDGVVAARNNSLVSSVSAEPQVSSAAPRAVDFFHFSCFPLGEPQCWITKQSPVKLEPHSHYTA